MSRIILSSELCPSVDRHDEPVFRYTVRSDDNIFRCPPTGLPSYGYMPATAAHTVGAGERSPVTAAAAAAAAAAATAYYTDYMTIPTHPHMANQMASQMAAVPVSGAMAQRNDQSPIPISTSPLHREHFSARGIGNAGTGLTHTLEEGFVLTPKQ